MQSARASKTAPALAIFVISLFIGGIVSYGQSHLEVRTLEGHTDHVYGVAVTPDGRHVVSGSRDKTVKLWELKTGTLVRTFEGHAHNVDTVAVTPNGRYAVSGGYDRTVRLWDIETPTR